jgi:hypothetical protein
VGVRVVQRAAAAALAGVVLVATGVHGVAVSTDSVSYATAAAALAERGVLEVPLTEWREPGAHVPLSHFPPLLPVVLAATRTALGIDVFAAAAVTNAVCIGATTLIIVRLAGMSPLATATALALLVGPSFVGVHLWLWSEPLFLTLVALCLARVVAFLDDGRERDAVLCGLIAGLATLTRYAGVFLVAGAVVVLARRGRAAVRPIALVLVAFGAVVLPWLARLAATGRSARTLGLFTDGILDALVADAPRAILAWAAPTSLTRPVRLALAVVVAFVIVATARGRTLRAAPAIVGGLALAASYGAVIVLARLTVDTAIPFDARVLVPALVALVPAVSDLLGRASGTFRRATVASVVGLVFLANVGATASEVVAARAGRGFTAPAARASETIAWLRALGPDVTIFSNAPDAIAAQLPIAAKYTPMGWEGGDVAAFADRVAAVRPAVVVLFASDPHAGWLLPSAALADLPSDARRTFADGTVLVWDAR